MKTVSFQSFMTCLELCKIRVSVFSALSAATGYILARGEMNSLFVLAVSGVLLLACGACALNQFQERDIDSLMERTKNRPLPAGRMSPSSAVFFSLSFLLAGFTIFFFSGNPVLPGLGLLALLWYNGIYTTLKRKSAFASVPGALVGVIPPVIGWSAAAGNVMDYRLFALCFFFFMWQIPHFWLLFLSRAGEYEKAGLPSMSTFFTERQIAGITFMWHLALAVTCLLIPFFGVSTAFFVNCMLTAGALWFAWQSTAILRAHGHETAYIHLFRTINIYALLIMVLLNFDAAFTGQTNLWSNAGPIIAKNNYIFTSFR